MGFLLFVAVVALGAIAWLLFSIDTKLQRIGDMIHVASRSEEPPRPALGARAEEEEPNATRGQANSNDIEQ